VAARDSRGSPLLGVHSWHLVQLIEAHSEQLARSLLEKLEHSERCRPFLEKVPREELRHRTYEVFVNLGEWLQTKTEKDIERRYVTIGERRAAQGITLDQLISSTMATKAHLWDYVTKQAGADRPYEFVQEMELFHLVEQFFDRAAYFQVIGYERYHTGHRKPRTKWEGT